MSGAYLLILGVSAGATWALTFVVRRIAIRFRMVQLPDERRVHDRPTPLGGGASMFLAFLLAMAVASRIDAFGPMFEGSSEAIGIVLGAAIIFGVGLLDDLREVSAPAKIAGGVFAGSVLALLGVTMLFFRVPFGPLIVLAPDMTPLVTVVWVIAVSQAVNLIDGLDGLAAGIVAIAAGAFFLYTDRLGEVLDPANVSPLLAVITVGVCLGFLPHNFHPARIFMGDAGALFLGLLLAATTLLVGGRTDDEFSGATYFFFAPMVIPFVILGVPFLDTAFAFIRRVAKRGAWHEADKAHLHHRLMRLGHGQRRSVLILWAWTAILSAVVLFPTFTNQGNAIIPIAVAALAVFLYTLFAPGIRKTAIEESAAGAVVVDSTDVSPVVVRGSTGHADEGSQ